MKKLWWILAIVLVVILTSCLSWQQPEQREEYPPLPAEIGQLIQTYGDPEIYPGTAMTMVWDFGDRKVHILLAYDPFIGWQTLGYVMRGEGVPSQFQLMLYEAYKEIRNREIPKDPWGKPITDPAVLNPGVR